MPRFMTLAGATPMTARAALVLLFGCALGWLGVSTPILAQDEDDEPEPATRARGTVELITVTAQRREESLQSVPVAVSAFSEAEMDRYGVQDAGTLQALTPGFNYSEAGSDARPTLRGSVVNLIEANADASVGFFVDGIFASRTSQATLPFVDMQRVEVLRGPQGTLFGRNTSAGAINLIPNQPDASELRYGVDLTAGNYETLAANGYVNVPIGETAAARFAFSHDYRGDGFVENLGPGTDYYDKDEKFLRAAFRTELSDRADLTISGHYFNKDDSGASTLGYKVIGTQFDLTTPDATRSLFGTPLPFSPRVRDGIPDIVINGVPLDIGSPVEPDPYKIRYDTDTIAKTDSWLLRGEANFAVSDDVNFKLLASYWDHDAQRTSDTDFTILPEWQQVINFVTEGQTTQLEAQLSSTGGSALEWVVGAFLYEDEQFELFDIDAVGSIVLAIFPSGKIFNRFTDIDTTSYAAYGQATYRLTDRFSLTGGARYTIDDKEYSIRNPSGVGGGTFDDDESFNKFTWRIGAEYQVTPESLLYASLSTGFRSGGFNRQPTQPAFDSETSTSFELGSKNDLFDGTVRLNLAAYYVEYEDLQVTSVLLDPDTGQSLGSFFQNAAEADSYGLEVELQAFPTPQWLIQSAMAFQRARYSSFETASNVFPLPATATVDASGNQRERSPDWTVTLASSYDFPLNDRLTLRPQLLVETSAGYHNGFLNTEIDYQGSFTKVNGSLWLLNEDSWSLQAWVRNATDEAVINYQVFGGQNASFVSYAPPRTYGVTFRYDW